MAKLKGPLFSLGAAGAIGESLVYFNWKGLNVVREYVVPSNPKSTAQKLQRSYVTDVVAKIHVAQGAPVNPMDEEDIMAYALWGSTYPTPRTWFNQAVKNWLDQKAKGDDGCVFICGHLTPGTDTLKFELRTAHEAGLVITEGDIWYGTSKTALNKTKSATPAQLVAGVTLTGLITGVKYYAQYRPTAGADAIGTRSGIYYGVPT